MAKKKKKPAKEKLLSAAKRIKQEKRAQKKLIEATKALKKDKKKNKEKPKQEEAPKRSIRVAKHLMIPVQPEPLLAPPPPPVAAPTPLKEADPEVLDLDRLHILGQILDYALQHSLLDEDAVLRWGKRCVSDAMIEKLNLTIHDEKLPPAKPIRLNPNLYGG
ncbi:hypothetical protein [Magnetococcus sp. PR-3]|uniref:hypothetical protein n=1 Tax=Magnetococcus sp. PR-3 TaxID=3120355 RepID=UPI002FCE3F5C